MVMTENNGTEGRVLHPVGSPWPQLRFFRNREPDGTLAHIARFLHVT